MIISIDIGTSYSSLCYLNKEEKAQPIEIATGMSIYGSKYSLPSAIFVEDSGNVLIGQAAMNMRKLKPQNFRAEFKRELGQNIPIVLGKKSFLPEDIYTEMFRHMKSCAEKYGKIEKAIITYPASYRQKKCEKIQKAAKNAGLFNVELIDEPTAAAMNYRNDGLLKNGDKFLVYDFGGGTFDVSLMQYQNGECEPLTLPMGAEHCGGIDVDRIIFSDILSKIDKTLLEQLSKNQIYKMRFESEIAEQSVKIKHHLSQYDNISVQIPIGFDMVEYHLTREQLNEKIVGLVSQTIDCCQAILNDASIEAKELNGIVLVGGTSRIPLVRTMLENFAKGVKLYANVDPELAVAQGAVCKQTMHLPEKRPAAKQAQTPMQVPTPKQEQSIDLGAPQNASAEVLQYYNHAVKGDSYAQYLLGEAILNGNGCTKDPSTAVKWLDISAKQGDVRALNMMGLCYENGLGVAQNIDEAFVFFKTSAERGFAVAQYNLAVSYQDGSGVKQDEKQAFQWYRKAAEQGYAHAQNMLGMYYDKGIGTAKNATQAFVWVKKAADQGDEVAQYNLGVFYGSGIGVKEDPVQAFEWYKKSAEQGNVDAQYNLAVYYQNGSGVKLDEKQAFQWYRKAAEQGHADAQNMLGMCYDKGIGTAKNAAQAFVWVKKAADQGDEVAQYNLGVFYDSGTGVKEDPVQAFEWYKKSAEQGDVDAQNMLGLCYMNGNGVTQDNSQAFSWVKIAAEGGLPVAQYNLGYFYQEGIGTKRNITQALSWYKLALDNGYEDANENIERLNKPRITLDELKKYTQSIVDRYNMGNRVFTIGKVDADKLSNAKANYASNVKKKDVLIQYDDTFWGGARDGFIMTSDTFYWHNLGSVDCGEIPLSEIAAFEKYSDDKCISIKLKDGQKISGACVSYGDIPKMVNCLNNLLNYINTHCLWS